MQLLDNMTEVVRKGILEAEKQLQKATEEKLMEEVCVCVCVLHLSQRSEVVLIKVKTNLLLLCVCAGVVTWYVFQFLPFKCLTSALCLF